MTKYNFKIGKNCPNFRARLRRAEFFTFFPSSKNFFHPAKKLLFCSPEFCSAENNDFFCWRPNHPKNCLKILSEAKYINLQRYFVQINDFLLLFLCFWKMSDFWCQNLIFLLDFSDFQKNLITPLIWSLNLTFKHLLLLFLR